jgi:hypothetical protein
VQHPVDLAPALAQRVGERVQILGPVDVELEHVNRRRQPLRGPLGHPLDPPEAGQQHLGTLVLGLLGGVERDRLLGDHARDQ